LDIQWYYIPEEYKDIFIEVGEWAEAIFANTNSIDGVIDFHNTVGLYAFYLAVMLFLKLIFVLTL
jgi:hypothetical protein